MNRGDVAVRLAAATAATSLPLPAEARAIRSWQPKHINGFMECPQPGRAPARSKTQGSARPDDPLGRTGIPGGAPSVSKLLLAEVKDRECGEHPEKGGKGHDDVGAYAVGTVDNADGADGGSGSDVGGCDFRAPTNPCVLQGESESALPIRSALGIGDRGDVGTIDSNKTHREDTPKKLSPATNFSKAVSITTSAIGSVDCGRPGIDKAVPEQAAGCPSSPSCLSRGPRGPEVPPCPDSKMAVWPTKATESFSEATDAQTARSDGGPLRGSCGEEQNIRRQDACGAMASESPSQNELSKTEAQVTCTVAFVAANTAIAIAVAAVASLEDGAIHQT